MFLFLHQLAFYKSNILLANRSSKERKSSQRLDSIVDPDYSILKSRK